MNVYAVCGRLKAKKANTAKMPGLRDLKNIIISTKSSSAKSKLKQDEQTKPVNYILCSFVLRTSLSEGRARSEI